MGETDIENPTKNANLFFFGEVPLVKDLLEDPNTNWSNIYLKTPAFIGEDYYIPEPTILTSSPEDHDKVFLYPENQYLMRLNEFLDACIYKCEELIEASLDNEAIIKYQKLKDDILKFKDNLCFITMHQFQQVIDYYAEALLDDLMTKTVFLYEQKARSERFFIVHLITSLINRIDSLTISDAEKEVLKSRIRYNPSFEESGTPTSYYQRAGSKITEDAVVVYVDDFIQSGNYVLSQRSGGKRSAEYLLDREGYRHVTLKGFYIAANPDVIPIVNQLDDQILVSYKMRGYWGHGLTGSWSSLDYLFQDQIKQYSKELAIPMPFGYSVKGRYDRSVTSGPGGYEYGDYYDSNFDRMFKRVSSRFAIPY